VCNFAAWRDSCLTPRANNFYVVSSLNFPGKKMNDLEKFQGTGVTLAGYRSTCIIRAGQHALIIKFLQGA
jgi:hypothetical protein